MAERPPTPPRGLASSSLLLTTPADRRVASSSRARPTGPQPRLVKRAQVVLVVDPDAVTRRYVERALERELGVEVECVQDATGAEDVLRTRVVDLIVAESELGTSSAIRLLDRLRVAGRLADIPVLVHTADTRVASCVDALAAGASDYVRKPCDLKELAARVRLRLEERTQRIAQRRAGLHALSGDLGTLSFPDVVSLLELSRQTGVLTVLGPGEVGQVHFALGRPVHAALAGLEGEEAFYLIMRISDGRFEFVSRDQPGVPKTLTTSATGLLLEGARRIDHDERATPPAPVVHEADPRGAMLQPPLEAAGALAYSFAAALGDPMVLGELRLVPWSAIAEWTAAHGSGERLHVHLVTSPATAVALLSIASPLSERDLEEALSHEPKALTLTFPIRGGRQVDLLVIDVHEPTAHLDSLLRRPAITIIAPPRGELASVGLDPLIELDELLTRRAPILLAGAGDAMLQAALGSLASVRQGHMLRADWNAPIDVPGADPRELLTWAVRAWMTSAGGPR